VQDYFSKRSNGEVKTLGVQKTWSFVVDESVGFSHEEELGDEGEDRLTDVIRTWLDAPQVDDAVDDAVFMASFIPHSLGEVYDPERDVDIVRAGKGEDLIYAGIAGLSVSHQELTQSEAVKTVRFGGDDEQSGSDESDSEDEHERKPRGFRHEDKDAKKVWPLIQTG
jgi:RIO kinase 1